MMLPSPPALRLLDADVLIDVQRGHPPAVAWFNALTQRPGVPGLVLMELIQDAQNTGQVRLAESLVHGLPLFWPSTVDCQRALTDYREVAPVAQPGPDRLANRGHDTRPRRDALHVQCQALPECCRVGHRPAVQTIDPFHDRQTYRRRTDRACCRLSYMGKETLGLPHRPHPGLHRPGAPVPSGGSAFWRRPGCCSWPGTPLCPARPRRRWAMPARRRRLSWPMSSWCAGLTAAPWPRRG